MRIMKSIRILCLLGIIVTTMICATSCKHTHTFSEWNVTIHPTCLERGTQTRTCTSCDFSEQMELAALGHIEIEDAAVSATCTVEGRTAGTHCGVCQSVIKAQNTIPAPGHLQAIDPAIPATCTEDGKTEGSHCNVCNEIIIAQEVISAIGHQYNEGVVVTPATCIKDGSKQFTCTVDSCRHTYTETYSMPQYSATELYNQSIKYVGEITTYDKSGKEESIGTGFVISSDGRIVTNYHVIHGGYSAKIRLNGTTYDISSVLAYDADIDLAVLKINTQGLTPAIVCKNPISAGETVYAMGSSRGMTNTYSQGIVTYANRVVDGVSYVQHDVSVTNGNSGGPLINSYGDVVGINAWTISNSQNLNFAIFTKELDNLTYGKPLTMAEFYKKECDIFLMMKNYIIENGTYDSDGYYRVIFGTDYRSDMSLTRVAYYYIADNEITLDLAIDGGDYWIYFEIDDKVDGSYYWSYNDDNNYKMSGTLYAATFTENTLLGYNYNNISSSTIRSTIRELASTMMETLCKAIDVNFKNIGITAADLGFLNY